jgi:hypothetical protein
MRRPLHVLVGAATAACFPGAAAAAVGGRPDYIVLGALAACLPDVVDDVCAALSAPPDITIVPDPADPAGCHVARALAAAVDEVRASGLPLAVHVTAPPAGHGLSLCCRVAIDPARRGVEVHVPAGGPGSASRQEQWAACSVRLLIDDAACATARPGAGLTLALRPAGRGAVRVTFDPRHRLASHGLVAAAGIALVAGLSLGTLAAAVAGAAVLGHALCDGLAAEGGVGWLHPVVARRRRSVRGALARRLADDPLPVAVAACILAGWSLWRAVGGGLAVPERAAGALLAAAPPLAFSVLLLRAWRRRGAVRRPHGSRPRQGLPERIEAEDGR